MAETQDYSGHQGLSEGEVRNRLAAEGHNVIAEEEAPPSALGWLIRALTDPMALLLLIASPTYLALGDYASAAITAAALVPVTSAGLVLEGRARKALHQLRELTSPIAQVIRDGVVHTVAARDLVRGDVVLVTEGDVIPADGVIVDGIHIVTNEAALTGESLPVSKGVGQAEEARQLFAGTNVVDGRALMEVTATGGATRFGQIAGLVQTARARPTPLQLAIRRLITVLGAIAVVLCLVVVGIQLARGTGVGEAIITGVSLAIAAIPEEFPIVFTLYLSLGAWRLTQHRALVRQLAGVETLGSTTVICTDKTGTLTMGTLSLSNLVPAGIPRPNGEDVLLRAALLASEPDPFDPLDLAILGHAVELDANLQPPASQLVRDYPFDSNSKHLTHAWRTGSGFEVAAKGAVEGLLQRCTMTEADRNQVLAANQALATEGLRIIGVAGGDLTGEPRGRSEDEQSLRFLGLIGFSDPIREGVAEALADCRKAGIRVIMITGDHPVTALAVARSLEMDGTDGAVVTGDDLDRWSDDEFLSLAGSTTVFARIRPEQKHRLVRALRASGEVVAMTGDGINDAPALKEADIGIAMGGRGTAVARESATLVLLDDNFATIVAAVREGRRIFESLRKAFVYLMACHLLPVLILALVVPLLGEPLLLLPVSLVILELFLHPAVSLVFENDPPDKRLMTEPPRHRSEGLVQLRHLVLPVTAALALTATVLVLYVTQLGVAAAEEEAARTSAFVTLVLGQLLLLLSVRAGTRPLWQTNYTANRTILPIFVATVGGLMLLVSVPTLNELVGMTRLSAAGWGTALVLSAAITLWVEPAKAIAARRRAKPHVTSNSSSLTR